MQLCSLINHKWMISVLHKIMDDITAFSLRKNSLYCYLPFIRHWVSKHANTYGCKFWVGIFFYGLHNKQLMMSDKRFLEKRIINVSNRLPLKITSTKENIIYQNSEGGLATGLDSVFGKYENLWIGWPGAECNADQQTVVRKDLEQKHMIPIFFDQDEINNFYEGFSNKILWPLFHYFTTYSDYCPDFWDAYVQVNRKFANAVLAYATDNDIIWIQDYHLMLLPQMLREANPSLTIGYFQHIPFPGQDVFRALPWKDKIIEGLSGADLIGFQTANDVKNYMNVAGKALKIATAHNEYAVGSRHVSVQAFPIGIDYRKFRALAEDNATKKFVRQIKKLIGTRMILSIDRLDYSKGIMQRLQAYDLFLKNNPDWHGKVTYVHQVVPSRENVGNYKALKEEMNRLISEINGKYATLGWQPIRHFYRSFPPNLLSAIYQSADLALVTPLIDGMNLVSKEYVASNISRNGVLVLSEGAGAAAELTEAIVINPNDITAFASAIETGLSVPLEERKESMRRLQYKIEHADIFSWAAKYLDCLSNVKDKYTAIAPRKISASIIERIDEMYAGSNRRLILLDYDGTIVPFYKRPEEARPDASLLGILNDLATDSRNDVVIISGRDNTTLEKWLGHLPIKIIAEHGAWFKDIGEKWQDVANSRVEWKNLVNKMLANISFNTPGTFVEEKTYSVAWHYRTAQIDTERLIRDIVQQLKTTLSKDLDILEGNKVIEVKSKVANKGRATLGLIAKKKYDFIMAIGDDKTDEDMFKALPEAITIKVGNESTAAAYSQPSYREVNLLLKGISERNKTLVTVE
jgi:trehalose 6-phosphate synthase/phosphatase